MIERVILTRGLGVHLIGTLQPARFPPFIFSEGSSPLQAFTHQKGDTKHDS